MSRIFHAALLSVALAAPAYAQTAEEIVAKNIQAKGGAEKAKAITSVRMTGTLQAQGMDLPMTTYAKRPNLLRQEMKTPAGEVVQAFDGSTAWMMPPGAAAPQEVTGPQADAVRGQSDFDGPLMDYKAKGHTVELVGKETVAGTAVHHLKLTKKDGQVEHYYISVDSGLEVKRAAEVDMGGTKRRLESELSDYKSVDGMMVPHAMKQSIDGAPVMSMRIDKIEFNPPLDDALFRMPKK
jgi:outer membrane lipoprotein-sorting protein